MSHIADLKLKIKDLAAWGKAVVAMGGEYLPNETKIRWFNRFLNDWPSTDAAVNRYDPKRFGTTDAGVARFKGSNYDIGLLKNADGTYTPYFDAWGQDGNHLRNLVGGFTAEKLAAEYGCQVAMREMARKGYRVTRQVDEQTGEILAICNKN